MTLHLELPADLEVELRARAEAAGKAVDAFVADVVVQRLAEPDPPATDRPRTVSHEEFAARLHRLATRHRGPGDALDDSRESIYAGRE